MLSQSGRGTAPAAQASPRGEPPPPEGEGAPADPPPTWQREKRGSGEPAASAEVRRQRVKAWQRDSQAWQCQQPAGADAWQRQKSEWYRQKSGGSAAASTAVPPAAEPTSDNLPSSASDISEESHDNATGEECTKSSEYYRVRNTFVEEVDDTASEEAGCSHRAAQRRCASEPPPAIAERGGQRRLPLVRLAQQSDDSPRCDSQDTIPFTRNSTPCSV